MISITTDQLQRLAPKMLPNYRDAFAGADPVLAKYGINDSGLRLAHFMAQILHESGAFTITTESLNYRPERLLDVWPTRFKTLDDAQPFAHNPEALGNKVYNGGRGARGASRGRSWLAEALLPPTRP